MFPIEVIKYYKQLQSQPEETKYSDAVLDFDTDYDRENPVTKKKALKQWKQMVAKKQKFNSKYQPGHQ